jgi:hypothetical protein
MTKTTGTCSTDSWRLSALSIIPPDEVLSALVTCMAKTITMIGEPSDDASQIEEVVRWLRSNVEFQRGVNG